MWAQVNARQKQNAGQPSKLILELKVDFFFLAATQLNCHKKKREMEKIRSSPVMRINAGKNHYRS
jgi:hypothetical protein